MNKNGEDSWTISHHDKLKQGLNLFDRDENKRKTDMSHLDICCLLYLLRNAAWYAAIEIDIVRSKSAISLHQVYNLSNCGICQFFSAC